MQWSKVGAHLLLQTRTQTLDGSLRSTFQQWYTSMANDNQKYDETAIAAWPPHKCLCSLPRQFADALRQYSPHQSCAQSSVHNNTIFAYLTFTPSAGFQSVQNEARCKCGFRLVEALVAEVEAHVSAPLMPALLQAITMLIYHRAPGLLRCGHF